MTLMEMYTMPIINIPGLGGISSIGVLVLVIVYWNLADMVMGRKNRQEE